MFFWGVGFWPYLPYFGACGLVEILYCVIGDFGLLWVLDVFVGYFIVWFGGNWCSGTAWFAGWCLAFCVPFGCVVVMLRLLIRVVFDLSLSFGCSTVCDSRVCVVCLDCLFCWILDLCGFGYTIAFADLVTCLD